jgi:hypothetical protein
LAAFDGFGAKIRQEKRASYQSREYEPQVRWNPGCERHDFILMVLLCFQVCHVIVRRDGASVQE